MKLFHLIAFSVWFLVPSVVQAQSVNQSTAPVPLWGENPFGRPSCVKGIHLTAWYVGHKKFRPKIESLFADTELNTAVIAVKEVNGEVYIPGVQWDTDVVPKDLPRKEKPYRAAMRDIESYLKYLKERGIYTIARVTVFQDQIIPKLKPEWAVKSSTRIPKAVEKGFEPDVWVDRRGLAWADPYNSDVHEYNITIAERAAQLGFQGIQFDYIRFPSDGKTRWCRYSKKHSKKSKPKILSEFLRKARERLKPYGVEISIDTFGLAGSLKNDLGIGQKLSTIIEHIDVLSPMMYPSHYAKGEYGLKDPNSAPYETVYQSVKHTLEVLEGTQIELRPFLQDFSLGVKYTAERVRAQIDAAADLGVHEWLLWNPRCRYTEDALIPTNQN